MEQSIALMIGTIALVLGLSVFIRQEAWGRLLGQLRSMESSGALVMGYLHLIFGSFIVAFHWKWHGPPLVITLIGVKAVVEGVIYMLFPRCLQYMLGWYEAHQIFLFRMAGVASLVIALIAFSEWAQ